MATIEQWTPFGVALNITATAGTVTRTSATRYTVVLNVSWKTYWNGATTWYGMWAYPNDLTYPDGFEITPFGSAHSSGSKTVTATYSISGTAKQTKSITVTFENWNRDNGDSAKKSITLSISVPAWPTYAVKYNANGGTGAPASQTKIKGTALKLSTTKPTRTGYTFQGWGTTESDTSVNYAAGANYTSDAAITLYAIWKANTYTIKFNANGGEGAPANQTKTYGTALTLTSSKPTRANYNFLGWSTSASATTATYSAGGSYTSNSAATLYAVWELAYWAPKVMNVLVGRCDEAGNDDELGAYIKASFDWECCQLLGSNSVAGITVAWREKGEADYANNQAVTPSGDTAGTQSVVFGGSLSSDVAYEVQITVTDGGGGEGAFYYARSSGKLAVSEEYWITKTNDIMPEKYYTFGPDGKMIDPPEVNPKPTPVLNDGVSNGIVSVDGVLYYYEDGQPVYKGLFYVVTGGGSANEPHSTAVSARVSAYTYTIDLLAGGKGVAFGKPAEKVIEEREDKESSGVEFAMPIYTATNNTVRYYGTTPEGKKREIINPCNASGNLVIGYGGYLAGDGATVIYGNEIMLQTNGSQIQANKPVETYFRTCRCNTEQDLTTQSEKLDMSYTNQYNGNLLTLSGDGGIKCETDGFVIVYGTVYALSMTAGHTLGVFVGRKKSDGTSGTWGLSIANTGTRAYATAHIAPACISVSANDVIYHYAYNVNGASGVVSANTRSLLTVQYI